jgi:hypothetical protein
MAARCDVLARESRNDRWEEDEVDERWIELRSASFADHADRVVDASSLPVATTVRHGIECVGDRHDARLEWNARSAEAARISSPVPALVV